jgi:Ca2+-transporting ATPase
MSDSPAERAFGLTDVQAQARLHEEGHNELPRSGRRRASTIVADVVREPILALLLGAGAIYLALGDRNEALILLAFALLSVVITVVQEARTERALEALRDLASPRALVVRGGVHVRVAGRDVVRDDVVILDEGDRVPADAIVLDAHDLHADESLLTGESVPVRKRAMSADDVAGHPGGDDLPFVYAGSLVSRGSGVARVTATGARSEIGRIGASLRDVEAEPPRLQTQTRLLVRTFALVGAAVSVAVVGLYGVLRGGWLDALLAGIAIVMSMLPEELPVVLTVFMAVGAWRISHARVLTRRAATIETLGAATVLCTDKTGTLTQNRMLLAALRAPSGDVRALDERSVGELDRDLRALVECGRLASSPTPVDPMDRAVVDVARRFGADGATQGWRRVHGYGLRSDLLATTHVWRATGATGATRCRVAAKGAPEAIAGLCRMDAAATAALRAAADAMADSGLRVLGVARSQWDDAPWPASPRDFAFEFVGLVGLADPLRPQVPAAIRACRAAGIRVVMVTGDYPTTARAIAAQAGLAPGDVVTGDELDRMPAPEFARRVAQTTVFARIMPQQKLAIVEALKANGDVVAMTGDGVNDAPSLKAAHIGIAMGARGTDVAREASSLVLLDDDFGAIVAAVRLGRRIYDNVRKAMGFIFAVHVPIAGLALLPLLFGMPIVLGPIHIAFLQMVIDPVCSLVFEAEAEEDDVMARPPRAPDVPLFGGPLIGWGIAQGIVAFGVVAVVFVVAASHEMPDAEVRALTFFTLVLTIVGLVFVNRSFSESLTTALRRRNPILAWVLLGVAAGLTTTLTWSASAELFRFGPLHAGDLLLTVACSVGAVVLLERLKPLWRNRFVS